MTSVPISHPPIYPDYCHRLSPTIGKWCPLRATDVHALRDVEMFCDGRILYHHLNHPIKWVRLTGVVVAVDVYPGLKGANGWKVFTLDDSSGVTIGCCCVMPATKEVEISIPIPGNLNQAGVTLGIGSKPKPKGNTEIRYNGSGKGKEGGEEGKGGPSTQNPNVPWQDVDVGSVIKVKGRVGTFRDNKWVEVVKIEVLRSTDQEVRCWDEMRVFGESVLGRAWVVSGEEEAECRRVRERELRRGVRERYKIKSEESSKTRERGLDSRHKTKPEDSRNSHERAEARKKQREQEKREVHEDKAKRRKERDKVLKTNYLSVAVRQAAGGKYDKLGT